MASNNQRAPSVPLPTRWSNEGKKNAKEQQQIVLNQVREMFGTILDRDIILSVVQNCKWQLQPSIEALIMLSENAEAPFNNTSENPKCLTNADLSIKVGKNMRDESTMNRREIVDDEEGDGESVTESFEESVEGLLNLNDKELLRQQNEFRKFELLKKDLTEKGGFLSSSVNDNLSDVGGGKSMANDKVPSSKLQQFGNRWKNDYSKVYYCSEVENANQTTCGGEINPMVNQLWDNKGGDNEQRKIKETNNQFENLFGSKLQFSRDMSPKNFGKSTTAAGGTIPKKNRTPQPDNSSSSSSPSNLQWRQQQQQQRKSNVEIDKSVNVKNSSLNSPSKKSKNEYAAAYNQNPSSQDPSHSQQQQQQQVSQFDSNYDNETKTRTASSGKSNVHKGETESLCGLKVQYRLPGLENSSDDDADVVIEEERTDYPTQIPSLLSTNVCQFISCSKIPSGDIPSLKSRPGSRETVTPTAVVADDESSPSTETSSPFNSPQHNSYDNKLAGIITSILKGHKILIIIRGPPGSGKTHLGTNIVKSSLGGDERQFLFSTDDYFVMANGVYNYVKSKLTEAHAWNERRVSKALKDGVSPVIVANTNTKSWEMQPCVVMGVQNGYAIEILEPSTPWSRNLKELVRKNKHGVPKENIKKMMERYEHNLTGPKLIEQFGLRYSPDNVPPQMRKIPPPPVGENLELESAAQKSEKLLKPPAKRTRWRKKKKTNGANANVNNPDPVDCLLSDSDKNINKRRVETSRGHKTGNDTLEEIVSNALMSENETLNKSLVDYCIETDSGDEIDVDGVPRSVSGNREVDLFGENIGDDKTTGNCSGKNSSPSSSSASSSSSSSSSSNAAMTSTGTVDKKDDKKYTPTMINEEDIEIGDDDSRSKKSSDVKEFVAKMNPALITHNNQNLGAIGSERRENVPTIDFKPLVSFEKENESESDNSLSQCWDFTLLIGDRKIHSGYHFSKTVSRPAKTNIENNETNADYKGGVIITEITEETEIEMRKEEFIEPGETSTEDLGKIMKKMDEIEPERKFEDGTTELGTESEEKSDRKDSQQDRKDSLKYREGTMKYKRQTNDNSLSENDAFENEMSHREQPSLFVGGNGGLEGIEEVQMTSTTIDDSLSEKLCAKKIGEEIIDVAENGEDNSCRVSEPVTFDNLEATEELAGSVVEDTLSRKLSKESSLEIGTEESSTDNDAKKSSTEATEYRMRSVCVNSSSETLVVAEKKLEEREKSGDGDDEAGKEDREKVLNVDVTESEGVDRTAVNPLMVKSEEAEADKATNLTEENRDEEFETIAGKFGGCGKGEEKSEVSMDLMTEKEIKGEEEALERVENNEEDKLELDKKIPEEKSNVGGCRFTLKTISTEDGEIAVLVDVNKDEMGSLDAFSDGESMTECCENIDENGIEYPEGTPAYWEIDESTKPAPSVEEKVSASMECETCDDLEVGNNSRDCDKEQQEQRREDGADKNAIEIIDNVNRVTWKELPFPLPPPFVHSSRKMETNEATTEPEATVARSESSTNTSDYDFNVSYVGGTTEYKVINGKSRNINSGLLNRASEEKPPPVKLMLDKSSMTSVVNILSGDESGLFESKTEVEALKDVEKLMELFPNVSRENINDIYRTLCDGDFDWAVEMLIEGVPDQVAKYAKIEPPKITIEKQESSDSHQSSQSSTPNKFQQQRSSSIESNDCNVDPKLNFSPKKKKDRHKVSEENLELKRQIEEKMVISEASYNPHILKVKRWKNGEPDLPPTTIGDENNGNEARNIIEFSQASTTRNPGDCDDCESTDVKQSSPKSFESRDDFTEDDIEPEEMMELNLGEGFIKVLETEFGNPDFNIPDGLFPVIQIKKSMAQQLHALWIESMEQQMTAQQEQLDEMIEKDAELARFLEQEEARGIEEPIVPNLSEIMDMDMALAIYNNDLKKQVKLETPNDMASRLTRQMLHEMFVNHDPETLNEILNAHHGNFKETVDVLEASTGQIADRNSTLKKQKSLIDRAKKESIRSNKEEEEEEEEDEEEERDRSMIDSPIGGGGGLEPSRTSGLETGGLTYDDAIEEARLSRLEAQRQLSLRNENFSKAQEAFRKGNRDVAGYYSEIAKLHKKKMEYANATAASAFLAAQDYKMNAVNTLDLHYLYVAEALSALDVFLDYQISKLNQGNKKFIHLYIITGRGAHSNGGYSRLKPAVSKKLASKNIRYIEENPGCLKIVIYRRNNALG